MVCAAIVTSGAFQVVEVAVSSICEVCYDAIALGGGGALGILIGSSVSSKIRGTQLNSHPRK